MNAIFRVLLLIGGLAVAGCTNGGRFGDEAAALDGAGAGAASSTLDPGSDPSSPQYFSQTIGDRVLFAVDQHTLSPQAEATLAGQAGWLTTNPDYAAVIEGHADEQGTREYNLALGARRANSVREYLISQGVAANRLKTISYGKERPIAICSEESCYAKNRRAVTVISAGVGS